MSALVRVTIAWMAVSAVFAAWMGYSNAQPQSESDKLLVEVKAVWEKRQSAIRTAKFTWSHHTIHPKGMAGPGMKGPEKDVVDDGTGKLLLDGSKSRLTFRELIWSITTNAYEPQHKECSFIGEKYTTLTHHLPDYNRFPYGLITKNPKQSIVFPATLEFNFIDYWPLRVAVRGAGSDFAYEALEGHTKIRRTALDGQAVIELTSERTETRGESKLWLDPAQDYAIRRYDAYAQTGTPLSRIDIVSERHPSGIWLPKKWTIRLFASQGKLQRQTEITLQEATLNPPTTEADFEIVFPPKARVDEYSFDKQGQSQRTAMFIVREDGSHRPVTAGEQERVLYEDLLHTEPGELTGEKSWWKSKIRLLVIGGAILVVVIVCLIATRLLASRRKRFPPPTAGSSTELS